MNQLQGDFVSDVGKSVKKEGSIFPDGLVILDNPLIMIGTHLERLHRVYRNRNSSSDTVLVIYYSHFHDRKSVQNNAIIFCNLLNGNMFGIRDITL